MINNITGVTERFLRYVSVDTQSLDEQEQIPSTEKQLKLAAMLKEELEDMGVSGVRMDEHGYVYVIFRLTQIKNFRQWVLFLISIRHQLLPVQISKQK